MPTQMMCGSTTSAAKVSQGSGSYLKFHITRVHPPRQWNDTTVDRDTTHQVGRDTSSQTNLSLRRRKIAITECLVVRLPGCSV